MHVDLKGSRRHFFSITCRHIGLRTKEIGDNMVVVQWWDCFSFNQMSHIQILSITLLGAPPQISPTFRIYRNLNTNSAHRVVPEKRRKGRDETLDHWTDHSLPTPTLSLIKLKRKERTKQSDKIILSFPFYVQRYLITLRNFKKKYFWHL